MHACRFDTLARTLAGPVTRRTIGRALAGLALGGAFGRALPATRALANPKSAGRSALMEREVQGGTAGRGGPDVQPDAERQIEPCRRDGVSHRWSRC